MKVLYIHFKLLTTINLYKFEFSAVHFYKSLIISSRMKTQRIQTAGFHILNSMHRYADVFTREFSI